MASDARRRAEEALAKTALLGPIAPASSTWVSVRADDLAALLAEQPGHNRITELESLLRECNAVCLCGCPDGDHAADECGESCGNDDHECIRVAPAVLAYVNKLRSAPAAPDGLREAAEAFRAARTSNRLTCTQRDIRERAIGNLIHTGDALLSALAARGVE